MKANIDFKDLETVLRCRKTKRYFADNGWTEEAGNAKPFPDEEAAMRAVRENELRDVEVVVPAPAVHVEVAATPIRKKE